MQRAPSGDPGRCRRPAIRGLAAGMMVRVRCKVVLPGQSLYRGVSLLAGRAWLIPEAR